MKITIFGLTLSSSWGNGHATPYRAILRALHSRGHQVSFYEKDVEYYSRHRDLDRCDYCDLVFYENWDRVRLQALGDAADSDAVIVGSYCPEGARISDEILAMPSPMHIFYDLDTPITLGRLKASDLDYLRRDQVPAFDLYLSFTGGRILGELENVWGARCARPLYGCVDPDVHMRVSGRDEFRCGLSYMGTYAADREFKVDMLFVEPARRLSETNFILAGSLYPWEWQVPNNVRRLNHVSPEDHPAFYSSSRATLNITRDGMARTGYCPSGRFFEAAACGTPILSDAWEGIETFFTPGEEILLVHTPEDVVQALQLPEEQLAACARRTRQRTLDEHTGETRALELLKHVEESRWSRTVTQGIRTSSRSVDREEVTP